MVVNFPIDKSYLVGGWLASMFWGSFNILFIISMSAIFKKRQKQWFSIGAIVIMWSLATTHIAFILSRLIEAFIVHVNEEGAVMYLADIGRPLNRAKDMVYITTIVLGDSILVWRCFMVWNRNWYVIILPVIMVIGTAISGYTAVGQYFLPNPYVAGTVRWATGMLAVSMVTNLVLTLLTAGRIWFLTRQINLRGSSPHSKPQLRYRAVILIILEAGMLVTIGKVTEFILFNISPDDGLDGNNALYVVMDCMPQLMGIAPTLIVLAVNQGLTSPGAEAYSGGSPARWQYGDSSTAVSGQNNRIMFNKPPGGVQIHKNSTTYTSTTASTGYGDVESDMIQMKQQGL
ncbi:hypothetical protein BXZ70DRAFT_84752 [Cristinia sonorae]|uniref:Uncharacterized protein n=1 Tax=Cristinia sonorae TaxID=1940300 RepID=A0A8K0USZ1_9AGAR|nr:hypothetical protein BXZ70DRAFT_84752 [Cristinia sonorae]